MGVQVEQVPSQEEVMEDELEVSCMRRLKQSRNILLRTSGRVDMEFDLETGHLQT